MKRLDATDDPRPMSVSLRPQNGQLSIKDEKNENVKQEENFFREINTKFFFTHKNTTRNMKRFFVVKWSTEVCFVLGKFNNKLRIRSGDLNKRERESTNRKFFGASERRCCVLQFVQKEENVSLY